MPPPDDPVLAMLQAPEPGPTGGWWACHPTTRHLLMTRVEKLTDQQEQIGQRSHQTIETLQTLMRTDADPDDPTAPLAAHERCREQLDADQDEQDEVYSRVATLMGAIENYGPGEDAPLNILDRFRLMEHIVEVDDFEQAWKMRHRAWQELHTTDEHLQITAADSPTLAVKASEKAVKKAIRALEDSAAVLYKAGIDLPKHIKREMLDEWGGLAPPI